MWELSEYNVYEDPDAIVKLGIDEAYINVTSSMKHNVWLYSLSEACVQCPYTFLKVVHPNSEAVRLTVDVSRKFKWAVFLENGGKYIQTNYTPHCLSDLQLGEFGVYEYSINDNGCPMQTLKEPVDIYLSMLYVILLCGGVSLLLKLVYLAYHYFKMIRSTEITTSDEENDMPPPIATKPRLRSIDAFRGISIVLMIFVNSGGGHYWWIEHSPWNGLHVADLLFPWFLWIMGMCIPMSIKSSLSKGISKGTLFNQIAVRSSKLFLIGLVLNSINGPTLETLRLMGVLQRFGIAYFVVANLYLAFSKPIILPVQGAVKRSLYDISLLLPQWAVMAVIVIIHLGVTFGLDVPGCGRGYLGPGGKHDMEQHPGCIGGATGYIDKLILGENHIYHHPTARYIYDSDSFDPEGVFGCLLTILQVFLGVQCGVTMIVFTEWKSRIVRWLSWAFCTGLMAAILAAFSADNGVIPINKNLWSLSFVLVTSCFAFILLSFCYFVIDVKQWWSGNPMVYAGMNAIIMYVGHTIFHKMLPWHWKVGEMNTHFMLLLECTWNTALWVVIAYYLYLKKIFFSL